MAELIFAEYGKPPNGPNNLIGTNIDWPQAVPAGSVPPRTADSAGDDAASASQFLLSEPGNGGRGHRSYVTSAHQLNVRQDTDHKSVVGLFANTSGPGTELIPNAPDGSRFLPKLILLSLVRRWSIDVAGVVMSDKWGEVSLRPLVAPIFASVLIAGTPLEACYIWSLFYDLGLKMLELMTVSILMGQSVPTSRMAAKVLGRAHKKIHKFKEKFEYCLTFALTQALIGTGDGIFTDTWDFSDDEVQITSRQNPFCRWLWAELTRLGDEYFVHFRYKMYNFAKDVLEDFPPLLGPNLVAATSAIRAKYNLIRATEDVGLNLSRFFAIPTLPFSNSLGIQPSFNLITSEALIHLAKALIKILGDDQAAFSLYLRKRLNPSCEFTHRIFVWPAVFMALRIKTLSASSGYQGANSFVFRDNITHNLEADFLDVFGTEINEAMADPNFNRAILHNTDTLQEEANLESLIQPLL